MPLNTPSMISRRSLLSLAGASVVTSGRLYAASDFWNRKEPAQWSAAEIHKLLADSPWAKSARAQYLQGAVLGCSGGPGRGGVWKENPPVAVPPRQMGRVKSQYTGKVLWESAGPIRDARRTPLPEQFAGHYVIRVSDFPAFGEPDCAASTAGDNLDNLKEFAILEKQPVGSGHAAVILRQASATFLFGFLKSALPLAVSDGEVTFSAHLDRLVIQAKFTLKEMNYHNTLAL